jgi:hypothetical protein
MLSDTKRVKYGTGQPTTQRLQIAKRVCISARQRNLTRFVSDQLHRRIAKIAFQTRLRRRKPGAASRYVSEAHVVRTANRFAILV